MTKPDTRLEDGTPCASDDPQRLLWYAANCTYWTDDWSKLKGAFK